jgi:hypothetical protein
MPAVAGPAGPSRTDQARGRGGPGYHRDMPSPGGPRGRRSRGRFLVLSLLVVLCLAAAGRTGGDDADARSTDAGCSFSTRGIPTPDCGALLGAAYGANTDPTRWEASLGRPLGVRRTYYGSQDVDLAVATAAGDVAAGRIPWISFKLPYSWQDMAAGRGDGWVRDLATRLAGVDGPVWVAFHHEPEGDGDVQAWRAMQEHLAPIVRSTAPNVAYSVILMGWHQVSGDSRYGLDDLMPRTTIDIAGFDPYNWYATRQGGGPVNTTDGDMKRTYFDPISRWAKAHDVAWAVAETGYRDDPEWLQRTFDGLQADGGIAMTYFDTWLNQESSWSWGLDTPTKRRAFAETLAGSVRRP